MIPTVGGGGGVVTKEKEIQLHFSRLLGEMVGWVSSIYDMYLGR